MKVVGLNAILAFTERHANAKSPMQAWVAEAKEAEWKTPEDMKKRYPRASILSDNRVVLRIKGNDYRMVVRINYATQVVRIERIGTHAEYDKWNLS